MNGGTIAFSKSRMEDLLGALARMAGGDIRSLAPMSDAQDELDAISHAVNVMAGELNFRVEELQRAQADLVPTAKLAALGEVSSGLAHELNNPLTIIRGYVEMALEAARSGTPSDARVLEQYLGRIDTCVDRMDAIIRHIMEFSRQTKQTRQPIRVAEVVRKSFILLSEQLRLKNIRVQKALVEDLFVLGDELRLEQVLINLLNNARDAIVAVHPEELGGGRIVVETRLQEPGHVLISVEDNGTGIDEGIRSKIFNPFFTTKDVGKGTGLGLSISLGIIEEHNGSINCESESGKGTRITLRLPRWDGGTERERAC